MPDFAQTIKRRIKQPYEFAHEVLDRFSFRPDEFHETDSMSVSEAEIAAMSIIMQCAVDNNKPYGRRLSKYDRIDALAENIVSVAAIGMNRHDVAGLNPTPVEKEEKHLRFVERSGFRYTVVNTDAAPDKRFVRRNWEKQRLEHIDFCLKSGVNIISLGEFDYPPVDIKNDDSLFNAAVQAKVDAADHPVFLICGTRHDLVGEIKQCENAARIFTNSELEDVDHSETPTKPIIHRKLVSATKAGERLSPPNDIKVTYYSTKIGKIGVLICVDAYNPTLIFSLFEANQKRTGDRLDYIIVPSYNHSPKLYYACQVLSLLCGCYVILVDACSHCSNPETPKPSQIELFINGRKFSDIRSETDTIGAEDFEGKENIRAWTLPFDFLRSSRIEVNRHTPFLNRLQEFYSR